MKTLSWTTIDKSSWKRGPWDSEPDKKQWEDPTTHLPCLIVRNHGGALCGYVGVPQGHPWHGKSYSEEALYDISVHGGLTFAKGCGHDADPSTGICHLPDPGEPDNTWWFGFDCAHHMDLSPGYESYHRFHANETYRDLAYVEREIASLALQLQQVTS